MTDDPKSLHGRTVCAHLNPEPLTCPECFPALTRVPVVLKEHKRRQKRALTDAEFRDKVRELYVEHGKTGVSVVQTHDGGCIFNWINVPTAKALELVSQVKVELASVVGKE